VADQRITQLAPLAAAAAQGAVDVLPVADVSTAETKKITLADAVVSGIAAAPNGSVPGAKLVANSVTSLEVAPNAITAVELADGAVDTTALQNLSVTAAKIAADTITAAQVAPNAIGASELANGAVDTAAIADGATTYAKIQAVNTDRLLGRVTTGAGVVEEVVCTAAGRALLDDADAAAQRTTLGLGTLATQSGTFSGTHSGSSSGTNTGDQTITLTGPVTGSGTGSFATTISAGAINTAAIVDGAVTAVKIAADAITAAQIAPNAIGASELAGASVDTAALQDNSVSTVKLIDGAVTSAKLGAGAVTAAAMSAGSVTTASIANGAVTSAKLAADLDGSKFLPQAASTVLAGPATGAAAAPTFRALAPADLPVGTAANVGAVKIPSAGGLVVDGSGAVSLGVTVAAGTKPVVTYDSFGRVTAGRALVAGDLPLATTAAVGAVRVAATGGIAVDANGEISLGTTVTAGTSPVVTYDSKGRVTSGRALAAGDLPIATTAAVGGVQVGSGLSVDAAGLVTVNLRPSDVPGIDASKITSGTLATTVIPDRGITQEKLANYSIAFIQEASPPAASVYHHGMLWFQESTGQLRMWNGNSWFPVGFGRLSAENLRYCGTFDAATGTVTGVTQFGTTEGFKIGDVIPSATDAKSGVYFVCTTPGNGTPVATGVTFDNGDWILCNGLTAGWVRVDTLSGGGGGGGASNLDDLLDVTLTAPAAGDALVLGAGGQWVNQAPASASTTVAGRISLATQAEVDAGTDALKAVTSKTLQDAVLNGGSY
jgi:hypothetical protein